MPLPFQLSEDLAKNDVAVNSLTLLKKTAPNLSGVLGNIFLLEAARTLLDIESGAEVVWNHATGFTITLPTPVVGMRFRFRVGVTNTGGNHKVITSAGTVFLKGSLLMAVQDTTPGANPGPKDFPLDGSTHVAITMNGSTTGGLVGTWFDMLAISTTVWLVNGYVKGSGTIATPAATS